MTRPTLYVVGKGEPVDETAEAVAHANDVAAQLVEAARSGFGFWVFIDGDDPLATYCGDPLEMSATAEEAARVHKLRCLGMGE